MSARKLLVAVLAGCAGTLFAQVPPGSGVYSSLNVGSSASTGSGLTIFKQYNGTGLTPCPTTAFVRITGLPSALAIPATSRTRGGANCVLVRDSDGSVVAGTSLPSNWPMTIYHMVLRGTKVQTTRAYVLGTANGGGPIDQMAWFDDDQIVFCYRGLSRQGWPNRGVGRLRLSTGVFTSINIAFPRTVGGLNAMALDRGKRTIYAGFFNPNEVWSVGLAGGTPKLVVKLPDGIYQLDLDQGNNIYVATFNSGLYVYQPAQKILSQFNKILQMNGMTIDKVSGDVQLAQSAVARFPSYMFRYSLVRGGALFGVPGVDRMDAVTGIAIRSCMIPMKTGSPAYWWMVAPNPGGAPLVGSAKFALTAFSSAKPTLAGLLLSRSILSRSIPLGCARLWLAPPLSSVPMTINAAQTEASTKLPIPNAVVLCGTVVYAQSYFVDACGLNSIRPLQVTLQ